MGSGSVLRATVIGAGLAVATTLGIKVGAAAAVVVPDDILAIITKSIKGLVGDSADDLVLHLGEGNQEETSKATDGLSCDSTLALGQAVSTGFDDTGVQKLKSLGVRLLKLSESIFVADLDPLTSRRESLGESRDGRKGEGKNVDELHCDEYSIGKSDEKK